jgi:hypothetical protein
MFCSAMFVTLFGVEHKPKPAPVITPDQQKAYDERMGTLRAEYDFNRKVS